MQVVITNTTQGAETYNWSLTGATPSRSTDRNPGTITYSEAGDYTIRLEASNQDGSMDAKEVSISVDATLIVGFTIDILENNFPPMQVSVNNTTQGAHTYHWMFENGNPESSTDQHPDPILFNNPGEYTISLEVRNELEIYQTEQTVTVAPHLVAAFDYEVSFKDEDFEAPVSVTLMNNSISAAQYNWTFTGGTPPTSTAKNPMVTFSNPGTYTLQLEATNGKETQAVSQEITILPNTNLRTFKDIELGINSAHNSNAIGAFFSTITGEVYKQEDVNDANGSVIDLAFFGLNPNFTFNKFISPDKVQTLTFTAIPNATHTQFINLQESCGCSASLSAAAFDSMIDDTLLAGLTITETTAGLQDFDDSVVPRIVLFETEDGRKGAIKIRDFVKDGVHSYVRVDIKVQKEPS